MKTNAIFDVAFEFDDSCSIKVKITFYFKMKNSICSLFYVLCITMCYLEAVPSYQNFALKNYIKIDVISKFNENVFQMFLVYILYDDNVTRTGSMLIDGIRSSADSRMTCQFHLTSGIREKTNIHEHCFERSLGIKFKYTGKKQEAQDLICVPCIVQNYLRIKYCQKNWEKTNNLIYERKYAKFKKYDES